MRLTELLPAALPAAVETLSAASFTTAVPVSASSPLPISGLGAVVARRRHGR